MLDGAEGRGLRQQKRAVAAQQRRDAGAEAAQMAAQTTVAGAGSGTAQGREIYASGPGDQWAGRSMPQGREINGPGDQWAGRSMPQGREINGPGDQWAGRSMGREIDASGPRDQWAGRRMPRTHIRERQQRGAAAGAGGVAALGAAFARRDVCRPQRLLRGLRGRRARARD